MAKKPASGLLSILLLIGILTLAYSIRPIKASNTIYIRVDGSIDPSSANITSLDNVTYYFTDNNYDEIVVERDNIILDGAGYTLQGTGGSGVGILLDVWRSCVTIKNVIIEGFHEGIVGGILTSNNTIRGNLLTGNDHGIWLFYSSNNTVSGNNITANEQCGVVLHSYCTNNTVSGNNITANRDGVYLYTSSNNTVCDNNITGNEIGILIASDFDTPAYSHNNTVSGNSLTDNSWGGIAIEGSNNTVCENHVAGSESGIRLIIDFADNNTISRNCLTNNYYGISLEPKITNNKIYHNDFLDNTIQAYSFDPKRVLDNIWDDDYPSGGNYWSDYNGTDLYSGPYQNETGADGIGDTPYIIDGNNTDRYPLMTPILQMPWDITGPVMWVPDGKCDIRDVAVVALRFGSQDGDGRYDARADITGPIYLVRDGKIDIRDVALVALHFGEEYL